MPEYWGKYAYCSTIEEFLKLSLDQWLQIMKDNNSKVSPHDLDSSQERAWVDCYHVLYNELSLLSDDIKNLHIIFEYVLPRHMPGTKRAMTENGIRADVIILSSGTSCVIEFKQRDKIFIGFVNQARMYRNRIQDYHRESRGMNKKSILLLTKSTNLEAHYRNCEVRSPDKLDETLEILFKNNSTAFSEEKLNKWLNSDFIVLHPQN